MPRVLAILAEGFEEIEAIAPIDLLRRAGANVTSAALGEGMHVTGRSGVTVHADATLAAVEAQSFDCVFLPGGPGVKHLRADPRVRAIVTRQAASASGWLASSSCGVSTSISDCVRQTTGIGRGGVRLMAGKPASLSAMQGCTVRKAHRRHCGNE